MLNCECHCITDTILLNVMSQQDLMINDKISYNLRGTL